MTRVPSDHDIQLTEHFSVVSPMKPSAQSDDTDSGGCMTSSILSYAKSRRRILTAAEELALTPVVHSQLNHASIAALQERQQCHDRAAFAAMLLTSTNDSSRRVEDPNKQVFHELPVSSLSSTGSGSDEAPIRISFRTNIPLGGKTAFVIDHRLSEPLSVLRTHIIQSIGVTPTGPVTIHRNDTGEELLPLTKTLLEFGFRLPPLLRVNGFLYEMFLVCPPPLGVRVPLPWSPNMTLTDVVRMLYKRMRPEDLRRVRVSSCVDKASGSRTYFDISRCFVAPEPMYLHPDSTLKENGFCVSREDPVCIRFLRTKGGQPLFLRLSFTGNTSLAAIAQCVADLEQNGSLADHLDADSSNETSIELVNSAEPFDDEDEEIRFMGESQAPSPSMCGKRVYHWRDLSARGFLTLSFNPTPEACAVPTPRFIDIDEDFTIPHLTDLGIFPSAEIYVEFHDPLTGRWSGDVAPALTHLFPCDPVTRVIHTPHELLTIRSMDTDAIHRVPCGALTSFDAVQLMYWCATGSLPMFTVLQRDNGNLLSPFETMASANMLPQATLFASHRPRVWLRETLRDVKARMHEDFAVTAEPKI